MPLSVTLTLTDDDVAKITQLRSEPQAFVECTVRDYLNGQLAERAQIDEQDKQGRLLATRCLVLSQQRNQAMDALASVMAELEIMRSPPPPPPPPQPVVAPLPEAPMTIADLPQTGLTPAPPPRPVQVPPREFPLSYTGD